QKRTSRNQEAAYRPYRQANQRSKARKKKTFRDNVSKFFSYQNPIVRRFYKEDPSVFGEDAGAARREKRAAEAEKKRKQAERLKTPAVIYTQPTSFNSRRLAIQLTTILAVVLALVLGMSVFFKVEKISVIGANVYSDWTVREKSGINIGDNLLTFGRTKASGQIIANLPYVKSARIGIKLPDTVIIEIEEEAVVYSIQDQDGVWWLMNSDGKVVEQTNAQTARTHTQVLGVTLYQPQPSEPGVATEEAPTETNETGEAVPVMITGAQRLNAALKILQALELNDIVGDAASVDVSQLQDIILWYGTQYQVNLGSINNSQHDIVYKITYMKNAILQMSDYQTGILDVSFTTWPDQVGYTPFG
ncbi:MAG: cell division protein FtsQ/DivIB, partial [Faecousia sp.]